MSESIAGRVGRIISGSFNALIDAVENVAPETVMEEAIREIDDAIAQVRTSLGKTIASKHLATKRMAQENERHESLAEKLELALAEGREDLAEAAIARQLDIEAQIPVLEQALADCSAKEKELEGYILALQAKKREMHEELANYRESKAEAEAAAHTSETGAGNASAEVCVQSKVAKAESAFDRVLARQSGVAGLTKGSDADTASKLAELETLSRKNRIKERLEAAKKQLES